MFWGRKKGQKNDEEEESEAQALHRQYNTRTTVEIHNELDVETSGLFWNKNNEPEPEKRSEPWRRGKLPLVEVANMASEKVGRPKDQKAMGADEVEYIRPGLSLEEAYAQRNFNDLYEDNQGTPAPHLSEILKKAKSYDAWSKTPCSARHTWHICGLGGPSTARSTS
jgi:hypothetical protein